MSFRDRLDVETLLVALGIPFTRSGRKLKAKCPNPDHQDSSPSWAIIDSPGTHEHAGHHCFAAETRVLTWDGYREIGDLAGTTARVLTLGTDGYPRWVDAPFQSFGVQQLWRVVVRRNGVRKTIRATAGHRWFVKVADGRNPVRWVERTTSALRANHQLRGVRFPRAGRISVSPWGVAHGFVERQGWVVESAESTDAREEVYCAVVPDSYSFALEGNLLTGNCFSCKFGGGPWELVMAVRGVDEEGAFEFVGSVVSGVVRAPAEVPTLVVKQPSIRREYELPSGVQIPSIDGSTWPRPFEEYLASRHVTAEQVERWRIGFATRGKLKWRVVIPVHTRGRLVAHVARSIFNDGSVRYDMPRRGTPGAQPSMALFGEPLLDPALSVLTIAEGSFSMLALERAGAPNPVALLGSDWSPAKAAILTAVEWSHVLIVTDPDMAGDGAARAISTSFRKTKISRVRLGQSPDDCEQDELQARIREVLS